MAVLGQNSVGACVDDIVHTDLFACVLAMAISWCAGGKVAFDLHAEAHVLITWGGSLFGKGWQVAVVVYGRRWEVIWHGRVCMTYWSGSAWLCESGVGRWRGNMLVVGNVATCLRPQERQVVWATYRFVSILIAGL
jgi:hypothetical protein